VCFPELFSLPGQEKTIVVIAAKLVVMLGVSGDCGHDGKSQKHF